MKSARDDSAGLNNSRVWPIEVVISGLIRAMRASCCVSSVTSTNCGRPGRGCRRGGRSGLRRGLRRAAGLVKIEACLDVAVIGLGASAATYYPAVGEALKCDVILPEHAAVANAIGAVVGRITMRRSGTITAPSEGVFRVHFTAGPQDFHSEDDALLALETWLCDSARAEVEESGSDTVQVSSHRDIKRARSEAREIFIEAVISVEATGRPRVARE